MKRFVRLIKNAELIVELAVQLYICERARANSMQNERARANSMQNT